MRITGFPGALPSSFTWPVIDPAFADGFGVAGSAFGACADMLTTKAAKVTKATKQANSCCFIFELFELFEFFENFVVKNAFMQVLLLLLLVRHDRHAFGGVFEHRLLVAGVPVLQM